MKDSQTLLLNILFELVHTVPDEPKRILFRGVSDLYAAFSARAGAEYPDWVVQVTAHGEDVVGARNDASIKTLVVFYRDEVRARESLNAFRQFNENAIAASLIQYVTHTSSPLGAYSQEDAAKLNFLLDLVYPSVPQLAEFLLADKERVGYSLPLLGLFHDPDLTYRQHGRSWQAMLRENRDTAVIRWRDFLEKSQRTQYARKMLGSERLDLLREAETNPACKTEVLAAVSRRDAVSILNPPKAVVLRLMQELSFSRDQAESLLQSIKDGADPKHIAGLPPLPPELVRLLDRYRPKEEEEDIEEDVAEVTNTRVNFCLEAVLRLAGQSAPLPRRLGITREDIQDSPAAYLTLDAGDRLRVEMLPDTARALCVPKEHAGDLRFRLFDPDKPEGGLFYFSLTNYAGWLEPYVELWPQEADKAFWDEAAALWPEHAQKWRNLEASVLKLRDIVDPDWRRELEPQEETDDDNREPNNPIYLIFDLVYLANRDLFEEYFENWLTVAALPWHGNQNSPQVWQFMAWVLNLGLAQNNGSLAVLPYHTLRLAWYRTVFQQIETWVAMACRAYQPLLFETAVLAEQLAPVERPRVLFHEQNRLTEAKQTYFFSLFSIESRKRRVHAPLDRARRKLEQFGRMWPFSLNRFHLAFQPGDAGEDVYRLLTRQADAQAETAFRVRAMVDNTAVLTAFDSYLFSTDDETTDLLTQAHYESLFPRVEYAKGVLAAEEPGAEDEAVAHAALLVDAFREESADFTFTPGKVQVAHWDSFRQQLDQGWQKNEWEAFKRAALSAAPYHSQQIVDGRRDVVYIPFAGDKPEYLHMLHDVLSASVKKNTFAPELYYERVKWNGNALKQLHNQADWVILFDRTLDRSFFEKELSAAGIRLIDFYSNLPGGYRLAVSSRRTEAVKWQLVQVLGQFFPRDALNLNDAADRMLNDLTRFASGLLLKTLGGGSLAQELLGLYATYLFLKAEKLYVPERDFLVPLDNYQSWFGRRTQSGRRADLLVVRGQAPNRLEMTAVESKWYKDNINPKFVHKEFGENGQLTTTVKTLHSLFNPLQTRLDQDYWQRLLYSLLDEAPEVIQQVVQKEQWSLLVDGMVVVHQYAQEDNSTLASHEEALNRIARPMITETGANCFWRGPEQQRLHLISYPELVTLFSQ